MADGARVCGPCTSCCTVLRVDELAKLGGRPCMHQRPGRGCSVYERRPEICGGYRCAWLSGAFDDGDRPDVLGAVLDFATRGDSPRLVIREAEAGVHARSPRLQEIAAEIRRTMIVEVRDVEDVLDPERPFLVLEPGGRDLRVAGDSVEELVAGAVVRRTRKPWLERIARRIGRRVTAWRLGRWPSHESRARRLARPGDD